MSAVGVKLMKTQELFDGDVRGVLEVARLCDELGIDQVHASDHVMITGPAHRGRPGFPYPVDYPGWFEPFGLLAAIAAVTERVQLASHVVVAPLRPAVVVAKQIATLDVISAGRANIGLGLGWQREEFAAAGMPFEHRLARLTEQVEVCRALWASAPASYHGRSVSFDEAYSLPLPPQGAQIPLSFGVPGGPVTFAEIARLGVGFCPSYFAHTHPQQRYPDLTSLIGAARAAYAEAGRDPADLVITCELPMDPPRGRDGRVDLGRVFADAEPIIAAGVDVLLTHVVPHCTQPAQLEPFLQRLLALRTASGTH